MFSPEFSPGADQLTAAYREVVAELVGDEALRRRCAIAGRMRAER